MNWIQKVVSNIKLKWIFKKLFNNDTQNFANLINDNRRQYWNMKIMNLNKHLSRTPEGVLYLFNYDKKDNSNLKFDKQTLWQSDKEKFTTGYSCFDYEDYKKILYYDDLYNTFINEYLYWEIPDDDPTEPLIIAYVKKVESYPSVKLKQIKEKFKMIR